MTRDVFISYSRENQDVADRIARDLADSGLQVFYDKDLVPGEAWGPRLEQQLRSARHILVLLSPSYVRSPWARRELEAAALSESEGQARIVPVLIQDTEIPAFLSSKHYADLRADYEAGLALIKKALTAKPEIGEVSRARRYRRTYEIMQVLVSLVGAATASVSMADVALRDSRVVVVVAVVVTVLTGFIAFVSIYRPRRRSKPLEIVTQGVERAYIDALERSDLNPVGTREVSRA